MKLPELPERCALWKGDQTFHIQPNFALSPRRDADLYTADQLRAYGEMVREECARVAAMAVMDPEACSVHPDIRFREMSNGSQTVAHMTAQSIASAIRKAE